MRDMHTRGEAIREARLEKGLTQAQLADAVQVTQTTISRVESGDIVPTVALLARIRTALDLDAAAVL